MPYIAYDFPKTKPGSGLVLPWVITPLIRSMGHFGLGIGGIR